MRKNLATIAILVILWAFLGCVLNQLNQSGASDILTAFLTVLAFSVGVIASAEMRRRWERRIGMR